jgi:Neuraminidase (sialidase)
MNKYISTIFLIILSCFNLTYAQTSTGDVNDIVTVDELEENSIYDRIWQPYMAQWDEQTYVIAYSRQLKGKVDMGDIICSVSKDQGKTWGVPITIFDSQVPNGTMRFAYANAVLYKDPEQDILWCYAMRCPRYYRNSEESEMVAAYSGDGGLTWFPVELMVDHHSPIITIAGIKKLNDNKGNRYLLPVHRNTKHADPHGDRRQFVLESRDLLHWKLAGYVPMPEPKVFLHEGNIAEGDREGELKIVTRTATYEDYKQLDPPVAYSSVSTDGGRTWSVGKPEPELFNTVSKAFFGKDSLGNHIYVYSSGPQRERKELWYNVKSPNQKWSEARRFYFDNNRNSYPTLIEEKAGGWLCTWDSSNDPERKRTVIRVGRVYVKK